MRYLASVLEKVSKRALDIILPGISYELAFSTTGLTTLEERRAALCTRFTQRVDKTSPLYNLSEANIAKQFANIISGLLSRKSKDVTPIGLSYL